MTKLLLSQSNIQSPHSEAPLRHRSRRPLALTATALLCGLAFASACGDDDPDPIGNGGSAGQAGSGGAAGAAGNAGAAGAAGAAGTAGAAGAAGNAGAAGAGGASAGPTGSVSVLNADAASLNTPTTAAIRGNELWVVNGQLTGLFGGAPAVPPFNLVSVPLAGGNVGATKIELVGDDIYPEGIAASADGTLYVGSLTIGNIVRIPAGSTTPDAASFVQATVSSRGVVGLTVDDARNTLWFCDSSPTSPGGDLVGVNLMTGAETVRHAMPDPTLPDAADAGAPDAGDAGDAGASPAPSTFCNDVVVLPDGAIFITDSSGRIFRIPAAFANTTNSAVVWLADPSLAPPAGGFGPNGIDFVDGKLVIASNGLFAVDPNTGTPAASLEAITLTENGAPLTLCGPDGIQAVPSSNDLVVVENGLCAVARERILRVTLDLD